MPYTPLTERVSKDTSEEERIVKLLEYYRDFLSQNLPGPDPTRFDSDVIFALVELKRKWRPNVEHLRS
jgi:hypothetical protein